MVPTPNPTSEGPQAVLDVARRRQERLGKELRSSRLSSWRTTMFWLLLLLVIMVVLGLLVFAH